MSLTARAVWGMEGECVTNNSPGSKGTEAIVHAKDFFYLILAYSRQG